jgi:hypothetical protein
LNSAARTAKSPFFLVPRLQLGNALAGKAGFCRDTPCGYPSKAGHPQGVPLQGVAGEERELAQRTRISVIVNLTALAQSSVHLVPSNWRPIFRCSRSSPFKAVLSGYSWQLPSSTLSGHLLPEGEGLNAYPRPPGLRAEALCRASGRGWP